MGVGVTLEALDAAPSAVEKESLSHPDFLHRLLSGRERPVDREVCRRHRRWKKARARPAIGSHELEAMGLRLVAVTPCGA
jgi:hypothetical protein